MPSNCVQFSFDLKNLVPLGVWSLLLYSLHFKISGVIASYAYIKGLEIKKKYDLFILHKYRERNAKKEILEI